MGVTISAAMPAVPPTTWIQDPAARKWAVAVSDSLRVSQSDEFAVQQLARAAQAISSGGGAGVPPSITRWLFSSQVYQQLSQAVNRVDVSAQQAILREAENRSQAVYEEQLARANADASEAASRIASISAEAEARVFAINSERADRISALSAEAAARGTAISNEASLRVSGDAALAQQVQTLTASTNSGLAAIQETLTTMSGVDASIAQKVSVLAATADAVRSSVASMVVQEARARSDSDSAFAQQISTINAAVAGNSAAIQAESQVRSTQYSSLAEQMALVSAGVGEQFDFFKIWYFDSGTDGWTGPYSPTASAGWLKPANQAGTSPVDSPSGLSITASAYSYAKARIRKVGAPVWAGALWWKCVGDSTWDASRSISIPEPAYDANGVGTISVSVGWSGTVDQVRLVLSAAQSDSSGFLIDWVAIGRPSPGASTATLQDEKSARAAADLAIASDVSSLAATVSGGFGTLNAAIANEAATRASADAAAASQITSISATANSRNRTFRQPDPPAASAEGDVWYDSDDGNKPYRWNGLSWILTDDARIAQNAAAITAEQTARANADTALTQQVSTLSATVTSNDAAVRGLITAEQTARADGDAAVSRSVDAVTAHFNAIRAATAALAVSETVSRATQDQAFSSRFESIVATVTSNDAAVRGLITTEQTARASADTAMTQQVNTLSATVSGNSAAITSEAGTRAANDLTIVQAINTMWAMTGANQAIQQSGSNLVSNWTASQANYWNTLNAEVFTSGGQTIRAALAQEASARATLAGQVQATWTVRVDANGYVAGVGLGVEGGSGGATSSFVVRADKFAMVMPGYGEYVPFAVGPTGVSFSGATSWAGVTGSGRPADNATVGAVIGQNLGGTFTAQNIAAYMPVAVIGQGQIQEAAIGRAQIQAEAVGYSNIGNAEIGTLKVAGEAITVPRSASSSTQVAVGAGGWSEVLAVWIDPGGGAVSCMASVVFYVSGSNFPTTFGVRIADPAGNVAGYTIAVASAFVGGNGARYTAALVGTGWGTGVFSLQINAAAGFTVQQRCMLCLGTKR